MGKSRRDVPIPLQAMPLYLDALADFRAGRLDAAKAKLAKLRVYAPEWPRTLLLEAYVQRAEERPLAEIDTLGTLLSRLALHCLDCWHSGTQAAWDEEARKLTAEAASLIGAALSRSGRSRDAVQMLALASHLEVSPDQKLVECSNAIFAAHYAPDFSPAEFHELHIMYRGLLCDIRPFPRIRYRHPRIRIGYLSADCCRHSVAHFLMPLLLHHDRSRFAVYVYAANAKCDAVTRQMQDAADAWRDISSLSDEAAARQMRSDELDILFDLGGHSRNTRLPILAYRPAAWQFSGIGYMGSSGMHTVDYFLSDRYCAAGTDNAASFTEQLAILPRSHFCYMPFAPFPAVRHLPLQKSEAASRPIVFGCFNNFSKVTDEMLGIWAEILCRVPSSRLLLKHRAFQSDEGRSDALRRCETAGISANRIELRGLSAGYLAEYNDMDIALDTYPYTGGLTTIEALLMGVPVITRYGERHGTRFGLSLLANAGLSELAAATPEDYIDRAVALASDTALLGLLHERLRQMVESSPLMDGKGYAADIEKIYRQIMEST